MNASNRVHVSATRALLDEAETLIGPRSRRELIDRALAELIAQYKQRRLLELQGDGVCPEYDYQKARCDAAD
jgi:hypothetical protein